MLNILLANSIVTRLFSYTRQAPTILPCILFLLLSCRSTEPVLVGIPEEPLLAEKSSADQIRTQPKPLKKQKLYQKSAGVFIDAHYLGGKKLNDVKVQLMEQLGDFTEQQKLAPKEGVLRRYDKGEIRVHDGRIYMIKFALEKPLRRSQTLIIAGFPEQVEKYITTHREYQLLNEWSFRRIRMKRESQKNELVTHFEAWKWTPNEGPRR